MDATINQNPPHSPRPSIPAKAGISRGGIVRPASPQATLPPKIKELPQKKELPIPAPPSIPAKAGISQLQPPTAAHPRASGTPIPTRHQLTQMESAARAAALRPNTAKSYAIETRRFALYAAACAASAENFTEGETLRAYALARAAGDIHLPAARLPAFTPATFRAAAAALKSEGKQIPPALQKHLLAAMQKTAAAPRRARPLSPEEVVAMAKVRASSGEAAAARDACMLLLAHIFALRVSNLQAARVADLQVGPRSLEFFVRADKGNAAGAHRPLFGRTEENAAVFDSAMAAAVRWLSARQSYSGDALFCVLRGRAGGGAIAKGHTITLMLRRAAEQSGLSPDAVARLTVHSLRRGRLQEFDTAGMPLGVAMQHSGHKSINGLAPYLRR